MKYNVRINRDYGGSFIFNDELGENHYLSEKPVELTIEQLGVIGLAKKRLICTPISDNSKPLVEAQPEPDGNPADVTQSAEVAEPMPDFEEPKTYTRPQARRGNGKKRR
jgi:hypothetical protein